MRVLIGGGSGFIGTAIKRQLLNKGHDVTVLSRTPGSGKMTWSELKATGLPACSAVISLSGENVLNPMKRWNDQFKLEVLQSRVAYTKTLANAIQQATKKPEVFATMSGVGYYPTSLHAEYTEDSHVDDSNYLTELCKQWEESGQTAESTRHVVIRTGVVLGKHGGAMKQMIWPFWFGVGGKIGSGKQYFPWIHIDDIAGVFVHAVESGSVEGILNGVAPNTVTNLQFTQALASAMWRPAILPVPSFVVNLIYGRERGQMLLEGQKAVPKRTLESGYQFKYPDIQSALEDILK
ncbi:epimerase family protein SDR39U1-like [Saccoglossus kowalevskii]|uniref:Epimerase family protein SDR39U1-like n=1 Tax=Saccoglossus kowalevskii TaxID=10224 RepID=A0ABM0M262_SACKO|nr:PREDICTED: epimerase family protein SDR39U1-like [Saccoglossus kowalevskii]